MNSVRNTVGNVFWQVSQYKKSSTSTLTQQKNHIVCLPAGHLLHLDISEIELNWLLFHIFVKFLEFVLLNVQHQRLSVRGLTVSEPQISNKPKPQSSSCSSKTKAWNHKRQHLWRLQQQHSQYDQWHDDHMFSKGQEHRCVAPSATETKSLAKLQLQFMRMRTSHVWTTV